MVVDLVVYQRLRPLISALAVMVYQGYQFVFGGLTKFDDAILNYVTVVITALVIGAIQD